MGNVVVAYNYPNRPLSLGNKRLMTGTITMSNPYAAGGDSILAGDRKFGLNTLDNIFILPAGTNVAKYVPGVTVDKVQSFESAAAGAAFAENGAEDLSTVVFPFIAIGA
jgi:hypothetical protein